MLGRNNLKIEILHHRALSKNKVVNVIKNDENII